MTACHSLISRTGPLPVAVATLLWSIVPGGGSKSGVPCRGSSSASTFDVRGRPSEREIKARAYQLWERAGRPENREDEFWHAAQQELRNEDKSSPVRTPDTL